MCFVLTYQGQAHVFPFVQVQEILKYILSLYDSFILGLLNVTFISIPFNCYSHSLSLTAVLIQLLSSICQSSHAIKRNRLPEQSRTKCLSANINMIVCHRFGTDS